MLNKRRLWIAQLVCAVMVALVTGGAVLLVYGLTEWNSTTVAIIAAAFGYDLLMLFLAARIDHRITHLEGRPTDQP